MTKILCATIWALALIFIAFLARDGVIEQESAATLVLVLPVLATMQISGKLGRRACLGSNS